LCEPLEPRALLAANLLADFYPLAPDSVWKYNQTDVSSGSHNTLTVTVARKTTRANGEPARRVSYSAGGETVNAFQNLTSDGKLHLHGATFDDGKVEFSPAFTLPRILKEGRTSTGDGDANFTFKDFDGDGHYKATATVGKTVKVTVPAGTFNAIKIKLIINFDAENELDSSFGSNPEAEGHLKQTVWLAKGVGIVRAEQRYDMSAEVLPIPAEYQHSKDRSGNSVLELKSYQPPAAARSLLL
jgi:hypothetical protein